MTNGLSLKNFSPILNLYARLASWLFALLLLTRFSPIGAGLTVVVVAAQVFIGAQLLSLIEVSVKLSELSRVGISFGLGAIFTSLIYVLVVSFSSVFIAILTQLILLFLSFLAWRFKSTPNLHAVDVEEIAIVKWLVVAVLAGLSSDWFWPLPVALFLVAANIGRNMLKTKPLWFQFLCISLWSGIGIRLWILTQGMRPNRPWFPDDQFGEIWSYSLGKWGLSHNPMIMGESISYHWFSFAWVGQLSNLTNVDVAVALTLFAPTVVAFACAILGYSIVRSFVGNPMLAVVSLCIAFVVDTERFFRGFGFHAFQLSSFSQFFSLFLGLCVTLIVVQIPMKISIRNSILISFLLFGLIGSKISSGVSVFCGLICVFLYQVLTNGATIKKTLGVIGTLIFASSLSLVFFFDDPRNRSASAIRRPGWTVGNIGDLIHVYNSTLINYLPILGFLILALGGLGFMTLLNIKNLSAKFGTQRAVGAYLVGNYVASLSQMWIAQADGSNTVVGDADNNLYAFQFVTSIAVLLGVANIFGIFENLHGKKFSKEPVLTVAMASFFVVWGTRQWSVAYSGSYATPFLTSLQPALPFLVALLLGSLVYFIWRSSQKLSFINSVAFFGVASLIVSGGYIFAANYQSRSSRQQSEWRSTDKSNEVSSDFASASFWIKQNSKESTVVTMKNERQSLSILTNRKDFAGFPITIKLTGLNSDQEIVKRMQLDSFAISGDCASAESLRDYGVSFFLVNFTNIQTPDIKRCADEVLRNKTIVIYSLNQVQD